MITNYHNTNTLKYGPYGWYFPYTNEKGKTSGLKLYNHEYENYYRKGYLKDHHFEEMLEGKTITFTIPKKSGNGVVTVTAHVEDYVAKKTGKQCKIIKFESDKESDEKIIDQNKNALLKITNLNKWWAIRDEFLSKLDLEANWIVNISYAYTDDNDFYFEIKFAKYNDSNPIIYYITRKEYDVNTATFTTEEEYLKVKNYRDDIRQQQNKLMTKINECHTEVYKNIYAPIYNLSARLASSVNINAVNEMELALSSYFNTLSIPNLEDRVAGLVKSKNSYYLDIRKLWSTFEYRLIKLKKNIQNYTEDQIESELNTLKTNFLCELKTYGEYYKSLAIRTQLYDEYEKEGLEKMVESINIDDALDLGYFPIVQKALVKYKEKAPYYIIYKLYPEITDANEFKTRVLNMLKIYYDFYNMPEKDLQSIAKYIAKHNVKEYYERISKYDSVLETIIDNSHDSRLTRPLLESIAGTSRANVLKDKTFYFEKRGYLRNEILLLKPMELVEELRKHIKEFNVSSGVAILTNIELDADESFIFQFYTFAEESGDEKGFDGRRMLNLTRIYNRHHPKEKIGFYFDNESPEDNNDD